MKNKKKCTSCEKLIDKIDIEPGPYYDIDDKIICEECWNAEQESAGEYASSCFHFGPDGPDEPEYFSEKLNHYCGTEYPEPVKNEKWVSSDAWRGYTDFVLNPGYVEVADGWVTGWPDSTVQRKIELGEIFQKLQNGEIKCPVEVWWLFGITSNVFSTASTIVVRENDVESFKAWVESINGTFQEFQEKFQ